MSKLARVERVRGPGGCFGAQKRVLESTSKMTLKKSKINNKILHIFRNFDFRCYCSQRMID